MPGWISRSSTDRRGGRVMHLLLHPLAKPLALVLLFGYSLKLAVVIAAWR